MIRLPRLALLLLLLSLSLSARAAGVEIVRVFTGWRDAESFQRVTEYLNGRENTGGIIVLRSQAGERAGFYWLVRLKNDGPALAGAKFELQVVTPTSPEPKTFVLPADIPAGSPLFDLGLTGADWPDAKAQPAAWRLRLLAADGRTLVVEKSYLWELPTKP